MRSQQALEGLKILDFTWWAAAPLATKHLGDFGAQVIKVESHNRLDLLRYTQPFKDDRVDLDGSGTFLQSNTSKYSITPDLTHPQGFAIIQQLVRWADAVIENFRPGTMDKLCLGYGDLRKIKEDIILVSSSSLGQSGAYSRAKGHAFVAGAVSGHFYLTGYADGSPSSPPSIPVADMVQPLFTVIALLAAVDYRRRTGRGQRIDISQIEPLVHFIAPALLDLQVNQRHPRRVGNWHPTAVPHGAFRCKGDDEWCAIAVFTEQEWQALCHTMGNPVWTRNPKFSTQVERKKRENELERLIEEWTSRLSAHDVMERLQLAKVAAGVVQRAPDLLRDDHLRERGSFIPLHHPVMGECSHPTPPIKLSRTRMQLRTCPLLGEHNEYVCTEILGMSLDHFLKCMREGVFEG